MRLGRDFAKASQAKELINVNVYFYLFVVEGLCEQGHWQAAVEAANTALAQIQMPTSETADWRQRHIQQEIRAAIQTKLVDAYENLTDFAQAFEAAKSMFCEAPAFALYKRARVLAEKGADVPAFLALVEARLGEKRLVSSYDRENLLRDVYSYEGEIGKMLGMAQSQKTTQNYYDRKYIALSLIYRAVDGATGIGESLSEYLTTAASRNGIVDMLRSSSDAGRRTELLLYGVELLRGIVIFHIDAAKRGRYAKAAYYMCVIRDIFVYLEREDEFKSYFRDVIVQNSRRPALRDEMRIVYGKEATAIKR